jgi:hypothetical protein
MHDRNQFLFALALFGVHASLFAQTATLTVNDPRPVYAGVLQIERLGSVPVNYEDLRYDDLADTQDITASIMTAAQKAQAPAGTKVIVPLGGKLMFTVAVDPASQALIGDLPTGAALHALLGAANGSKSVPGTFQVSSYGNAFFVEPAQAHNAGGSTVALTPVLSTPVNLTGKESTGWDVVSSILAQVSRASGYNVTIGTVPTNALALSRVSITASGEPANYVLSRLLAAIAGGGSAGAQSNQGMSYQMLFDPRLRIYGFNIHTVPVLNAPASPTPAPTPPAPPNPSRGFKKAP